MTNQKEAPEGVSFLAISEKDRGRGSPHQRARWFAMTGYLRVQSKRADRGVRPYAGLEILHENEGDTCFLTVLGRGQTPPAL